MKTIGKKGLVLLAFVVAAGLALWGSAAGAAPGASGWPLARSLPGPGQQIPLSNETAKPRALKGMPAHGDYAFLLKLGTAPTGRVYDSTLPEGRSAARTAAENQLATVRTAESHVIAALPSGSHVLYQTHAILAGVAVYTNVSNLPALRRISNVAAVYPIAPKKPSNSYSVFLVHAPQVWATGDSGSLGENSTIAIIDTGIDYTHADFGGPGTAAAYQTALAADTQTPDPSEFPTPSVKFLGGRDFAGDAYDAGTPAHATPAPDPNPLDCNGHGTHVAGTAAGFGENPDGSTFAGDYATLPTDSGSYQALFRIGPGMAPKAKLYAYKVFGCNGTTNLVGAALDRAADPDNNGMTDDHVDVVNMSLGSDFGSPQDGDSVASNAAAQLGISVVAASGNAGDLYDAGGSPGDAQRVIAVAASQDAYNQVDTLHVSGPVTEAGDYPAERSVGYDWANEPDLAGSVATLSDPGDASNQDGCDPISTDLTGKIAWLEWTDDDATRRCGSAARSANALAAGAIGAIFADDEDSFAAGITGSADIPVVMVTKTAGDTLRTDAQAGTLTISGTSANDFEQILPNNDDKLADFSSRGIREAGNVKPDVTGVGATVFSAGMGTGNQGLTDSGTSMATPEVAGLAALVHSEHTTWSPAQVKADIMNTAGQDVFTGDSHSGDKYGPNRVGAGRIDAKAALDSTVLAYDQENPEGVSASFGPVAVTGTATVTLHKTIELDNQSASTDETYDTSYESLTSVPGADYSVSPAQVTVNRGTTATVTLTLTIDPTLLTKTIDPTVDRLQDSLSREYVADASGRVLFTPQDASPTLRVPVYSAPRPATVMSQPSSLDMPGGAIQTTSLPLTGQGVDQGVAPERIEAAVAGFELQVRSGALPNCGGAVTTGCIHASDEKAADLKYVGTTSNAPELTSIGDDPLAPACNPRHQCGLEYFAIGTQGPWHTAASQNEYDIYIDSTGDGVPDTVTFNTRRPGTDVLVARTVDLSTKTVISAEPLDAEFGNVDTALFDSDTLVMPVLIPALGVSAGHSRITYAVATFGQFSDAPVDHVGFDSNFDLDGTLQADVLNPGIAVFGSFVDPSQSPVLYDDTPGTSLTVRKDASAYAADHGQGVLMTHLHNTVGNKAQLVTLDDTLTVSKAGGGSGSVTSSPAGISCGATCSHTFADGTAVALTATPAAGSAFTGWSGGGCSGTGTCKVTLNAATTVTATFQPIVILSVTKGGDGSGSVTSSPAGINCGATCSHAYASGTAVTLTAAAAVGSTFTGWSGAGCTGTGTCQVTVTAATTVTATFNKKPAPPRDQTRPKVTRLKVKVSHHKRTAKVTFRGTDPGHGSKGLRFKCKLDRKHFKSCRSPKLYKHLRHGKHTVQVKVLDRAGNVSKTAKRKFKV